MIIRSIAKDTSSLLEYRQIHASSPVFRAMALVRLSSMPYRFSRAIMAHVCSHGSWQSMKSGKKWLYAFRWNPVISGSPVPDTGHVALPNSDVVWLIMLITMVFLGVDAVDIARRCPRRRQGFMVLCESYRARPDKCFALAHDE